MGALKRSNNAFCRAALPPREHTVNPTLIEER
jgi:hypothetical protein